MISKLIELSETPMDNGFQRIIFESDVSDYFRNDLLQRKKTISL